jgi:hypothetical protein
MKQMTKFILTFLSFLCIIIVFWFRFLRERLPREIPFHLNSLAVFFCICLCISYLLVIILHITKPKISQQNSIINFEKYLYKPLEFIIDFFTENKFTKPHFEKYFLNFFFKLNSISYVKFYLVLEFIPRVIIAISFVIDVFYFNCLKYFYMFILLGIFLFIQKIIMFSIKHIKNRMLRITDERSVLVCRDSTIAEGIVFISASFYIEEQSKRVLSNLEDIFYLPTFQTDYTEKERKRLGLSNKQGFNESKFRAGIEAGLNLAVSLNVILIKCEQIKVKYQWINIIISAMYLICWSYILFFGCNTVGFEMLLKTFDEVEPFSGMDIYIN